jgi:hypothetical protein
MAAVLSKYQIPGVIPKNATTGRGAAALALHYYDTPYVVLVLTVPKGMLQDRGEVRQVLKT